MSGINWRPGPAFLEHAEDPPKGEELLVSCGPGRGRQAIVTIEDDGDLVFCGELWDFVWDDVEWYIPISELAATLPGEGG